MPGTAIMYARIRHLLVGLYGEAVGEGVFKQVIALMENFRTRIPVPRALWLTQRDAILITYADQVQLNDRPSLVVLKEFCDRFIQGAISTLHILPFFPWSSDDGFSVIDYRTVQPSYGTWQDIRSLGQNFRLMFDVVLNHVSVQSAWFQAMLKGDPFYWDFFISPQSGDDLSAVVRPRTHPLLTPFQTVRGLRSIWTTFSSDQVDLNYRNPAVLLEMLDILLFYVSMGAEFLRLDAIAYLWKEPGTSCIHLPQTHGVVQLFRAVLNGIAPHVMLITETNVPHHENLTYFGDGSSEAQMIYNFALPPLLLHTFHTGSAEILSQWAEGLSLPSGQVTFLNFLASHDGIGVTPVRGILSDGDIEYLVERARAHGGKVSYKTEHGREYPYELNINYFDALNAPDADEPVSVQINRFLAAHAILLSLQGVPGIYFHSLFGLRGWTEGVAQTGQNRAINRQKFTLPDLENRLAQPNRRETQIFSRLQHLLKVRAEHSAFHPASPQKVLSLSPAIFALLRFSKVDGEQALCLHNISRKPEKIEPALLKKYCRHGPWRDLVSGHIFSDNEGLSLAPYQTVWLIQS